MPSLNLDLNYFDHPKTLRLVGRLGPGSDVLPIRLWSFVGRHHPTTGRLAMLEAELEHVCGWWGDKGAMVRAMVDIGFIKENGSFFEVNDWFEHSGHLAAYKKRAVIAAKKRWGIKHARSNARSITSNAVSNAPAVLSSTLLSNTKEERRRSPPFQKPSVQEIETYIKSKSYSSVNAQQFFDHYESNGWRVGRNPMRDWQAAVRTWARNEYGGIKNGGNEPNGRKSIFGLPNKKSGSIRYSGADTELRKVPSSAGEILAGIRNSHATTPDGIKERTNKD